jgi:hypothetical protein
MWFWLESVMNLFWTFSHLRSTAKREDKYYHLNTYVMTIVLHDRNSYNIHSFAQWELLPYIPYILHNRNCYDLLFWTTGITIIQNNRLSTFDAIAQIQEQESFVRRDSRRSATPCEPISTYGSLLWNSLLPDVFLTWQVNSFASALILKWSLTGVLTRSRISNHFIQ